MCCGINRKVCPLALLMLGAMSLAQPVIIVPTPAWQESMLCTILGQSRSLTSSMMPQQVSEHLKNERP